MLNTLKSILSNYFKLNGDVDETIVIVSVVFLTTISILLSYVFTFHQDIPSGILNLVEFLWGGSVGIYISKGISLIFKK